jgi:hypothetical protein
MQWGEEVVYVAVEGRKAEGSCPMVEEECVYEWTVLCSC